MAKRYGKSLVVGKFMPPHNGHLHLIDTAAEHSEHVFVFCCSLTTEPIDGKLRSAWLNEIYKDKTNIHIHHIAKDHLPQEPAECADEETFWKIWCDLPLPITGMDLNAVFSSETYGAEYAKRYRDMYGLNVEHFLVDLDRETYPVSGTAVRNNPYDNWGLIPDVVKQYYHKSVVIHGPESTGKTTMVDSLVANFEQSGFVPEYGRYYFDEHIINKRDPNILDINHIAAGQLHMEELSYNGSKNIITFHDTNLIDTQVWSERYFDYCPNWIQEVSTLKNYDLHLLMYYDIDWVQDGTRESAEYRKWHFSRLMEILEANGVNFKIISGNGIGRFNLTKEIVEGIL